MPRGRRRCRPLRQRAARGSEQRRLWPRGCRACARSARTARGTRWPARARPGARAPRSRPPRRGLPDRSPLRREAAREARADSRRPPPDFRAQARDGRDAEARDGEVLVRFASRELESVLGRDARASSTRPRSASTNASDAARPRRGCGRTASARRARARGGELERPLPAAGEPLHKRPGTRGARPRAPRRLSPLPSPRAPRGSRAARSISPSRIRRRAEQTRGLSMNSSSSPRRSSISAPRSSRPGVISARPRLRVAHARDRRGKESGIADSLGLLQRRSGVRERGAHIACEQVKEATEGQDPGGAGVVTRGLRQCLADRARSPWRQP